MERIILHGLLTEYIRQLQNGVDNTQAAFAAANCVETTKRRVWSNIADGLARVFSSPDEETSPELWRWEETPELHPTLEGLLDTIDRMSEFADRLLENNE